MLEAGVISREWSMAHAAQNKDNLVHSPLRLFRQQGYASTDLQQVLAEAVRQRGRSTTTFPMARKPSGGRPRSSRASS
jgi:hypothetical protein